LEDPPLRAVSLHGDHKQLGCGPAPLQRHSGPSSLRAHRGSMHRRPDRLPPGDVSSQPRRRTTPAQE
ncbi:unnamed protein product, partial [Ostreobium quekettii]